MSLKRDPIISEAFSQLQNVISVNLNMWAGFTRRSCLLSAFRWYRLLVPVTCPVANVPEALDGGKLPESAPLGLAVNN